MLFPEMYMYLRRYRQKRLFENDLKITYFFSKYWYFRRYYFDLKTNVLGDMAKNERKELKKISQLYGPALMMTINYRFVAVCSNWATIANWGKTMKDLWNGNKLNRFYLNYCDNYNRKILIYVGFICHQQREQLEQVLNYKLLYLNKNCIK